MAKQIQQISILNIKKRKELLSYHCNFNTAESSISQKKLTVLEEKFVPATAL